MQKLALASATKSLKWVFERKTGRTVDHGVYGTNYTLKKAREVKKMILDSYLG